MNYNQEIRSIHKDLVELHGEVDENKSSQGVQQLIATILSQNVSDTNTERAMSRLLEEYGTDYEAIENESIDVLKSVIRPAGFPETKAERIQNALERIREENGKYSIKFLDDYDKNEAQSWLEEINGVGPKTANVVLSFSFGKSAMAVDTHVHRISERFGLIPSEASNKKAHSLMNKRVPDDIKYSLHMLMIEHGRKYCSAQNPDCNNKVCREYCECDKCSN